MTREDAIIRVKGYLTDCLPANCYEEVEEIIEALKQEPVLDKIKTEIEQTFIDDAAMQEYTVEECLRIIDKYKESEE